MNKFLFAIATLCMLGACTENDEMISMPSSLVEKQPQLNVAQAQQKFAVLLSTAVSNSASLRHFLRAEALAQFDNDYDVFYPLVKDKIVSDNQSFREMLLSYCKDEDELKQIENSLPLLTIYIPDLRLFWDFSAESWNANNEEIAVICRDDHNNTVYEKGESIGNLPSSEIPGFPCLVVKNNERVRMTHTNTRTGEACYEFIDDAFDGSLRNMQTRHSEYEMDLEETDVNYARIELVKVSSTLKEAKIELGNVLGACVRDYIYYGITKENNPGVLNRNMREELYCFKIDYAAFTKIADQEGSDPGLQSTSKEGGELSKEEIIEKVWKDGDFDIRFTSYTSSETGNAAMENKLVFSLSAKDLFSIEKVHVKHRNSTLFRHSKNTYTVDPEHLKSRWIYPEKRGYSDHKVLATSWDLYNKSMTLNLFVEEIDDGQTIKVTKTIVDEFANKSDFSLDLGTSINGVNVAGKLGYGFSNTTTNTTSTEITTQEGSDDLGTLKFSFYDLVLKNIREGRFYELHAANSGSVTVAIMPTDISH